MRRSERKKVLVICTSDMSAHKLLTGQINALRERGYRVDVACADGPNLGGLVGAGTTVYRITITNRANLFSNARSILQLRRLMRRERYDVVHVHMISAAFLGRIAAWLAGVPTIFYTFRGFAFYAGASRWLRYYNLFLERLCTPMTDFFFCQSEVNRKRAIAHGVVIADKSATIGNGIALDEFASDDVHTSSLVAAVRAELNIPQQARVIGFVGRLVKEKGVFEFIHAGRKVVESCPDAFLLVVGDALKTDRSSRAELERVVRAEGLSDSVCFTGFRNDVGVLYRLMDLFVLPSYREGMPRCIMEAMAAGLPVVASNIPGCQDEVIDGVTGLLVPPQDSEGLASAIVRILSDDVLAASMSRAGREKALDEFDEQQMHARIVDLYDVILEKGSSALHGDRAALDLRGSAPSQFESYARSARRD